MRRKTGLIFVLLALILVGTMIRGPVYGCALAEETPSDTLSPVAAADFTVYDKDGNPVRLSDFIGQPVVVNMWASWCGPCRNELPAFNAGAEENRDSVVFLMIDVGDDQDTAAAFLEKAGYTFDLYMDTDASASITYYVTAIPRTLFVNADGTLAGDYVGMIDEATLLNGIEQIRQ